MKIEQQQQLRDLIFAQELAALGTLHEGQPFVSMVPFAVAPADARFIIHVSRLAAHTRDMLASPPVGLLITAPRRPEVAAQAVARVSIQGRAVQYGPSAPEHAAAKQAYLARFPESADLFGFADFSLFAIVPAAIRFVGGFAQAASIGPDTLAALLRDGP